MATSLLARLRPSRSLGARLVLLGLLQLVVVAGTAVAIFILEGPHEPARPIDFLDRATRTRLEDIVDRPGELAATLAELEDHRIDVTLYDEQRQIIASNVEPPLALPKRHHDGPPPPPPPPFAGGPGGFDGHRPFDGRDDHEPPMFGFGGDPVVMMAPYHPHGQRGFLIARGRPGAPPGAIGPVLALISGFVVLVLGALVTARWIVRPIDRLSRTARALGEGDLAARSNLARADEIGELGQRFDEMAERITHLLRSEKELLANVAHELRTPLSRIGVALDLASEGDAAAARASLGEIAIDISELETIVDDILVALRFEIGRPGGGQLPLHRAITNPADIARAAADRLRTRHPDRELRATVVDDLPALDVDPRLVRRVIDNLLENAHKYSPDRAQPIELAIARASGDRVEFVVRDRGIGIDAHDLAHVFDAFFRSDRSRSRETGGVGLGLTLAKRIVDAHGGTIAVESAPGEGTTVTVRLPHVA